MFKKKALQSDMDRMIEAIGSAASVDTQWKIAHNEGLVSVMGMIRSLNERLTWLEENRESWVIKQAASAGGNDNV